MHPFTVLFLLSIACIWIIYYITTQTRLISAFAMQLATIAGDPKCFDYFITDGTGYYLMASARKFAPYGNPLRFDTLRDANAYLHNNGCDPLPLIRMTPAPANKSTADDIPDSFARSCNKIVAVNNFNADICGLYGVDNSDQDAILAKMRSIDKDISANLDKHNVETCIHGQILQSYPEFKDVHMPLEEYQFPAATS